MCIIPSITILQRTIIDGADLLEVRELVLVGCRDSDDLGARLQVLGNTPGITTILIKTNKLWNFIVLVNQVDCQPSVVVQ